MWQDHSNYCAFSEGIRSTLRDRVLAVSRVVGGAPGCRHRIHERWRLLFHEVAPRTRHNLFSLLHRLAVSWPPWAWMSRGFG